MEKLLLLCFLVFIHRAAAENVIYKLSKAEYSRMPPKVNVDRFDHCLNQPGGVYCTATADVVSDGPSELLDMMRGYSAHKIKHLNYTKISYGLCLTQNCRPFFNGSHDEAALKTAAEACLNNSLSSGYGLKTRVTKMNCYFEGKNKYEIDAVDWLVALLMIGIVVLNIAGTVYDLTTDPTKPANAYLTAFSLRDSWRQLTAPPSSDPKMVPLRSINGLRVITSILVILGHVPLPMVMTADNPSWIENANDVPAYHILAQGHLITLGFFLFSGLLLVYNTLIYAEKNKITWSLLPNAILRRFMRLSPINIVALLLTATWIRHTTYGPFWQEIIGDEVQDCRDYWYYNVFFLNNMVDHSQCVLQSWYLACDMHLHIIGLFILVAAPSAKARWSMLGALTVLGFAWPAYHIYSKDLDATLMASPTTMSEFFLTDPTFNWVYKQTYSNMPIFLIGMVFGFFIYDWQKRNIFVKKDFKKFRYVYWVLFPSLMALVSTSGLLYFGDAPRAGLGSRLLFAPLVKPTFVGLVMLIILGSMFKVDNVQRGVLEWAGWAPMSRVSYCVYAFHVGVLRALGGTRTVLAHLSVLHLLQDYVGVTVITLLLALVFYLLVEAPFSKVLDIYLGFKPKQRQVKGPASTANNEAAIGTDSSKTNGAAGNGTAVNGNAVNELNGSAANGQTAIKNKDA